MKLNMPRLPLDPADIKVIQEAATKRFRLCLGSLANQQIDKLIELQKIRTGPMYLSVGEMRLVAIEYGAVVRASAADYAAELGQAVGNRKGIGKSECDWVEQQVRDLAQNWISREFGKEWFINAVSSFFTIANEKESTEAFLKGLEFAARDDNLMTDAQAEIRHAAALYGRPQRHRRAGIKSSRVTPSEKLSDPIKYPVMTVPEVQEVTELSRSSVYRKLDDGGLKRAFAGKEPGKRCRCLIKTQSVFDFLQESPE